MSWMPQIDPDRSADTETEYECLDCGYTVSAKTQPTECPDCGSSLRNRGYPME